MIRVLVVREKNTNNVMVFCKKGKVSDLRLIHSYKVKKPRFQLQNLGSSSNFIYHVETINL